MIGDVVALADARGVKPSQIALAWLLRSPAVTAPSLASSARQIDGALEALDIDLSPKELDRLERSYRPHQVQHDGNEQLAPGQIAAPDLLRLFRR